MNKLELNLLSEVITNANRVLILTNKNSFFANGFDQVITQNIDESQLTFYSQFEVNPKLEDLYRAYQYLNSENFDLILGVGGGTPMDFAKALFYFLHLEVKDQKHMFELIQNPIEIKRSKKLILIPTTSGSGSDATHFSVIYNKQKKYSFANPALYPDHVVLDAHFTRNLPKNITAYTAVDAIVHAIESFWAKSATDISKSYALTSLEILVKNIKEVYQHPTPELRQKMCEAAHLAGKAIDISKTTAAHAFSYYLTTHYNIPHGQAVGLMLPYFIEKNATCVDLTSIYNIFNVNNARELKETFVSLLADLNLSIDILELIRDKKDFIDSVNFERLQNNPYAYTISELENIFS